MVRHKNHRISWVKLNNPSFGASKSCFLRWVSVTCAQSEQTTSMRHSDGRVHNIWSNRIFNRRCGLSSIRLKEHSFLPNMSRLFASYSGEGRRGIKIASPVASNQITKNFSMTFNCKLRILPHLKLLWSRFAHLKSWKAIIVFSVRLVSQSKICYWEADSTNYHLSWFLLSIASISTIKKWTE